MGDALKKRDERIDELCADIGESVREVVGQLVYENDILREQKDRLRDRIAELEQTSCSYPTEDQLSPEMRARLMPEGYEWPRHPDGRYVMPGDEAIDSIGDKCEVERVAFDGGNALLMDYYGDDSLTVSLGVKDADGFRILEGSMLYSRVGRAYTVRKVVDEDHVEVVGADGRGRATFPASELYTHNPVPNDADGAPIGIGDTVYDAWGVGWTVAEVVDGRVNLTRGDGAVSLNVEPFTLTHHLLDEKTGDKADSSQDSSMAEGDSWEKLEEDAPKATLFNCCDYFGKVGCRQCPAAACPSSVECAQMAVEDLVRRAKALAGEP